MEGRKAAVSAWRTPRITARVDPTPNGSQANVHGNHRLSKQSTPSGWQLRPILVKPARPSPLVSLRSSDLVTPVPPLAGGSVLPSPPTANNTSASTSADVPLAEIKSSGGSSPIHACRENLSEGKSDFNLSPKFLPSCARASVHILQSSPPAEILSLPEAEFPPCDATCRDVLALTLSPQIDPVILEPSSLQLSQGLHLGAIVGDSGVECALSSPASVSLLKRRKPFKNKPSESTTKTQQSTNKRRKPLKASFRGSSEQDMDHLCTHSAPIARNSYLQSESRVSPSTEKARRALSGPPRKSHHYVEPPPRFSDMLVRPVQHNESVNVGLHMGDTRALVVYSGPIAHPP